MVPTLPCNNLILSDFSLKFSRGPQKKTFGREAYFSNLKECQHPKILVPTGSDCFEESRSNSRLEP